MMDYSALIELLRQKQHLTDLEKDILDTSDELLKNPFDKETANMQALKNNSAYPDICAAIAALPTTEKYSRRELTESDLRYNLYYQLEFLIAKELERVNRRNN